MSVPLASLRLFVDSARSQSFSAAARRHGITQGAVSQRIGSLEQHLGIKLFNRKVRPMILTEAGTTYFAGCQDLIASYDELEQRLGALAVAQTATVRVAAIYSAGMELFGRVSDDFALAHPEAQLRIVYKHPDEVLELVRSGGCDLGVVSYPQRAGKLTIVPLRDEAMMLACPVEHPLARQETVAVGDLAGHEMIGFDSDLPVGREVRTYLRSHGIDTELSNTF
ncbi:MAG: LysR family transcriptional regulator, partial [Planctomycetota bacterium]